MRLLTHALVSLEKTPMSDEFSNWVPAVCQHDFGMLMQRLAQTTRRSDLRTAMT